uniref:Histone-lysine N-methyltransferase, H3 lysine-79 specific n=1 Tax=Rhabditophanes sp. KR3021 TaxID=114890 RepID=A0AC35TUA3_9BILA
MMFYTLQSRKRRQTQESMFNDPAFKQAFNAPFFQREPSSFVRNQIPKEFMANGFDRLFPLTSGHDDSMMSTFRSEPRPIRETQSFRMPTLGDNEDNDFFSPTLNNGVIRHIPIKVVNDPLLSQSSYQYESIPKRSSLIAPSDNAGVEIATHNFQQPRVHFAQSPPKLSNLRRTKSSGQVSPTPISVAPQDYESYESNQQKPIPPPKPIIFPKPQFSRVPLDNSITNVHTNNNGMSTSLSNLTNLSSLNNLNKSGLNEMQHSMSNDKQNIGMQNEMSTPVQPQYIMANSMQNQITTPRQYNSSPIQNTTQQQQYSKPSNLLQSQVTKNSLLSEAVANKEDNLYAQIDKSNKRQLEKEDSIDEAIRSLEMLDIMSYNNNNNTKSSSNSQQLNNTTSSSECESMIMHPKQRTTLDSPSSPSSSGIVDDISEDEKKQRITKYSILSKPSQIIGETKRNSYFENKLEQPKRGSLYESIGGGQTRSSPIVSENKPYSQQQFYESIPPTLHNPVSAKTAGVPPAITLPMENGNTLTIPLMNHGVFSAKYSNQMDNNRPIISTNLQSKQALLTQMKEDLDELVKSAKSMTDISAPLKWRFANVLEKNVVEIRNNIIIAFNAFNNLVLSMDSIGFKKASEKTAERKNEYNEIKEFLMDKRDLMKHLKHELEATRYNPNILARKNSFGNQLDALDQMVGIMRNVPMEASKMVEWVAALPSDGSVGFGINEAPANYESSSDRDSKRLSDSSTSSSVSSTLHNIYKNPSPLTYQQTNLNEKHKKATNFNELQKNMPSLNEKLRRNGASHEHQRNVNDCYEKSRVMEEDDLESVLSETNSILNDYAYLDNKVNRKASFLTNEADQETINSINGCSTGDKQILIFYAPQLENHSKTLSNAIESFLTVIENNKPPMEFVQRGKIIILEAHKLVYIGDSIAQMLKDTAIGNELRRIADNLCEILKTCVQNFPIISVYNGITFTRRLVLSYEDQEIYAETSNLVVKVLTCDDFPHDERSSVSFEGSINKYEYDYPVILMVMLALQDYKRLREIFRNESSLTLCDVGKLLEKCASYKELYEKKKDKDLCDDYLSIVDFLNIYNRSVREYFVEKFGTMSPSRDIMPPIQNCPKPMARVLKNFVVSMLPTSFETDINTSYDAFSNQTYGELYFNESVAHLIDKTTFSDISLIDMGSGIGSLVLQAAASSNVRQVIGIETNKVAYNYSLVAADYFISLLAYLNRSCSSFNLLHANFSNPFLEPLFRRHPPVLIMNNLNFTSISRNIQEIILHECKIGTKIISTDKVFLDKTSGNHNQGETEISGWIMKQYLREGQIDGSTITIKLPSNNEDPLKIGNSVQCITGNRDRSLIAICTFDTIFIYLSKPQILLASYQRSEEEVSENGQFRKLYWKYDSSALFATTNKNYAYIFEVESQEEHCLELFDCDSGEYNRQSSELFIKLPNVTVQIRQSVLAVLKAPIVCIVPLKDELFLSLKDGYIHRLLWDGEFLKELSFEVLEIPFTMDQVNSNTAKHLVTDSYIMDMVYCPLIGGIASVFNNGRAGLVISQTPKFEKQNIFAIWAGKASDYSCCATNHKYRTIYFGRNNGSISAFHIEESNGSLVQSFNVHLKLNDSTELLKNIGPCIQIQSLPQGNAFAAIFKSLHNCPPIVAIFSPFGAQWWCSLENYALRQECFMPPNLSTFDWGTEGFQLWIGNETSNEITIIPIAKNIMINHPAMESVNNIILLSERQIHCSPSRERERYSRASYAIWNSIEIPFNYIILNWPIRFVACDEFCEKTIAVAGNRGLAMYNLVSKKWKLLKNELQEGNISVTGGIFMWQNYLVSVGCDVEKEREEIVFFDVNAQLDSDLAFRTKLPNRVTMINFRKNYLMTLDVLSVITIYSFSLNNDSIADNIAVEQCAEIRIKELLPHPTCVVSIHLSLFNGQGDHLSFCPGIDTILINISGNLLVLSPQKKEIGASPPAVDKINSMQLSQPVLIASSVEHVWMNNGKENIPHLNKALWINCGARQMKIWLPLLPTTSNIMNPINLDDRSFLSRRIMLSFDANIYPLIISSDYLVSGIKSICTTIDAKNKSVSGYPSVMFSATRDNEVFIHQLLKQLLKRNLGIYSLEIAKYCRKLSYFEHVLELLLHKVLEEEATSSEPTPDPLMPRIVAFIKEFPEYLQTVVHCARKTELALWSYLFNACGHPRDLFRRCLEEELLDTATSYLIILQSTESSYASVQQASLLFEEALIKRRWSIARDIVRFLKSIDPSDMCDLFSGMNVTHKLSSQRGRPVCNVQEYQNDEFNFMFAQKHIGSKRKSVNISEPSSPMTELTRQDSLFSNDEYNSSPHPKNTSSVSIPTYLNSILKQHANYLLIDYSLRDLGAFSTHLEFSLVSFFKEHAKHHTRTIKNFPLALLKLHSQFRWPFPVEDSTIVDTLSQKLGEDFVVQKTSLQNGHTNNLMNSFVNMDLFKQNRGDIRHEKELIWLLNQLITAKSYEWVFLISVFIRNINIFVDSVKLTSSLNTEIKHYIRQGMAELCTWSNMNCVGYTTFMEKIKETINGILGDGEINGVLNDKTK